MRLVDRAQNPAELDLSLSRDPNVSARGLAAQVRAGIVSEGELAAAARVLQSRGEVTEAARLFQGI